jgi:NTE family protein
MFGAYQAGACKALAEHFRPDLIVGASAGALNGWALAGGCSPAELIATWTNPATADLMRFRFPARPWRGIFDPDPLTRWVDHFFARFQPRIPYGATLVEVPRLRQVLVRGERITPAHLRASCAIPFGYPPVRIEGKLYVDGGLLSVVPLWAAVEMGATRAVVVNALPMMPSRILRATVGTFRALAAPRTRFPGLEVIEIRPPAPLGSVHDALFWNAENVRRWVAQGESDAAACSITTNSGSASAGTVNPL